MNMRELRWINVKESGIERSFKMKSIKRIIVLLLALVLMVDVIPANAKSDTVKISNKSITILVGKTKKLAVTKGGKKQKKTHLQTLQTQQTHPRPLPCREGSI